MDQVNVTDELSFIKKVMEDSRRIVIFDAKPFIVWGAIITFGLLAEYLFVQMSMKINFLIFWLIVIGTGWVYSYFVFAKERKSWRQHTFADQILRAVWIASGIGMTIIGFGGSFAGIYNLSPFINVVLGIAYYLTGVLTDFRWMKYLTLGWWAIALILFFTPGMNSVLIMAVSMFCFQVIPGIVIQTRKEKVNVQ